MPFGSDRTTTVACLLVLAWCVLCIQSAAAAIRLQNRLADATSRYLREAARQPVHWQPWGEEAFRLAKELDRPILLDIGAIWCHWCHVMDEETYSDPAVAKLINDLFVPIKVDRDERPDIDARYQTQVQALVGYGGWPLTVFMTPRGRVFYGGGTFFPDARYGRPGFNALLPKISAVYRQQKEDVLKSAEDLYEAVAMFEAGLPKAGQLDQRLIQDIQWSLLGSFDEASGGFGERPKYFIAGTVKLAFKGYFDTGDQKLLQVATKTLDAMAKGGVHDQLGGGFHRYATDQEWRVPHFEKMLYDQAQRLEDYLEAYQATGNERYREVAERIIRYVQGSLSDHARGGFYAHQDADMGPKDDGGYYTWTGAEVRRVLPKDEANVILQYFDIGVEGEVGENPSRNVLWVATTAEEIAKTLQIPVAKTHALIIKGKTDLLKIREQRKTPFVDRMVLTDRNGMMISAYLEAYKVLGRKELKAFALKSLDFLLDHAYVPGKGVVHAYAEGKPTVPGFLQDQVQVSAALLDAFEVSGKARYLAAARDIMEYTLQTFWDEAGGFFDSRYQPRALGVLDLRSKPFTDGPTPAANPVAAELLSRLYYLTNHPAYRERARETLRAFAGAAPDYGIRAATYALGLDLYLNPPAHAVIIGRRSAPDTQTIWRAALRAYRPGKIVAAYDPAKVEMESLPPAVAAAVRTGQHDGKAKAYVCVGPACSLPTTDPEKVADVVMTFGKKVQKPLPTSLPGMSVPKKDRGRVPDLSTPAATYSSGPPTSESYLRSAGGYIASIAVGGKWIRRQFRG